jgi:hypothetical protein
LKRGPERSEYPKPGLPDRAAGKFKPGGEISFMEEWIPQFNEERRAFRNLIL